MKAAVQHAFGGVEAIVYEDVDDPRCGLTDVVVQVEASGLNRLDVLQRAGPALLPGFSLPHIAGMDVAGTVVEVGADVGAGADGAQLGIGSRVLVNPAIECGACAWCLDGDDGLCTGVRVIGATRAGGYAERCVVPADHVYTLPLHVSFEEAATIPTNYSTAWHALVTIGAIGPGEWLLVHGASSGVTIAAIQLAKRAGAHVVVTGRSEEKLALARRLGADAGFPSDAIDLAARCRELTGGRGVDLALDHLGPALWQQTIYALRPRGRLLFVGTTTGSRVELDLPYAYHFGISLVGVDPYCAAEFSAMLETYFASTFVAVVDSRFALVDAGAAQTRMERGEAVGKILLVP